MTFLEFATRHREGFREAFNDLEIKYLAKLLDQGNLLVIGDYLYRQVEIHKDAAERHERDASVISDEQTKREALAASQRADAAFHNNLIRK